MDFFYSKYNPQIKLSSKDILETSLEINEAFAPILALETTDLADFVRIFGDRLETNLYIWQSYAKGYPQDKMSVVAGIMETSNKKEEINA